MNIDYAYAVEGMIGVLIVFYVLMMALSICAYVFSSIGLFAMAKRRKIPAYGLAWVPMGNVWIMGQLADQFDRVTKGKDAKLRHWMFWLYVGFAVLMFISMILLAVAAFTSAAMDLEDMAGILPSLIFPMLLMLVAMGVIMACAVIEYIALYRIYRSANPDSATLLLILSIFFSICMPFFLFAIRKKDKGMPYLPE